MYNFSKKKYTYLKIDIIFWDILDNSLSNKTVDLWRILFLFFKSKFTSSYNQQKISFLNNKNFAIKKIYIIWKIWFFESF